MSVPTTTFQRREIFTRYQRPGTNPPKGGAFSKEDRFNLVGLAVYVPVPIVPRPTRPWRGQRMEEYYLELVDFRGQHCGYLPAVLGGRIDGVTDAPVARKLSGIVVRPGDWEEVNFNRAYLRPHMVVDHQDEPLGTFQRITQAKHRTQRGTYLELQCHDLSIQFQGTLDRTSYLPPGGDVSTKIVEVINGANPYGDVVVATSAGNSAYLGRPIGSVRYDWLAKLATLGGLTAPWYDRFTTVRVVFIPYAGYTPPLRSYNPGTDSVILDDSISETDDFWNVPTGWLVIGRSDQGVQYAGRYDLPNSHPMSAFQRGVTNIRVIEIAGVASQDDANARARDQAQTDTRVGATVDFDALADPTLEPWSIITYLGSGWLLDSWSHELTPGAAQHIRLRESILT